MLTQMDVLGRVLRHDKPAGMMFVEKDFYPKGTRPGPTAGVPPGKRALRLKASAVPGLHGLRQGDRFDIVMTSEVEIEDPPTRPSAHRAPRVDLEGPYASMQQAEMDAPPPPPAPVVKRKQADVQVVVEDGVLVQPIQERNEIETQASLLRGTSLRKKPIEELIIAVRPGEVAALNRAMAVGAHLQVAMRSGQVSPKDADPGHIPDLIVDPQKVRPQPEAARDGPAPSRFRMVEVITGGTKELISIPREKRGAAQAAHATK
jgi:Flp pilus assembly protein CpaB